MVTRAQDFNYMQQKHIYSISVHYNIVLYKCAIYMNKDEAGEGGDESNKVGPGS